MVRVNQWDHCHCYRKPRILVVMNMKYRSLVVGSIRIETLQLIWCKISDWILSKKGTKQVWVLSKIRKRLIFRRGIGKK